MAFLDLPDIKIPQVQPGDCSTDAHYKKGHNWRKFVLHMGAEYSEKNETGIKKTTE
ncbi:MAG: hypothetical protein DHS20C09_09150 [marine bacterium B5-7]|nr:MAG: hypothetical protein DHS20C09_09150 [marine bacterium B5-7]